MSIVKINTLKPRHDADESTEQHASCKHFCRRRRPDPRHAPQSSDHASVKP
jgi:hypothetical protein